MAITLRYNPSIESMGNLAYQTGAGQYAQAQQQQALEEQRLAQQNEQFNKELALRQQQTALQELANRRNLGAQMYQFDAQRRDRAAAIELVIASRFQQELLRQQGFADMRQSDQDLQTQRLAADLSKEQLRIKQHYQDREFNTAMAAAKMIEENRPLMRPEQYDQARASWDQRYGQTAGEYPFVGQDRPQNAPEVMASFRNALQSGMGDNYVEGMENWMMNLEEPDRLKAMLDLRKMSVDREQAQRQIEMDQAKADQKIQSEADASALKQQMAKEAADAKRSQDILDQQQALELAKQKALIEMEIELNKPIGYTKGNEDGTGQKPIFMEDADKRRILQSIGGLSIGGGQQHHRHPRRKGLIRF